MLKALAGGGGRGMRAVECADDLEDAFKRCASEATKAFGSGELYVEQFYPRARHIEVQIIGDGQGGVSHLWDRECSLQRQRQKLVEIAPAFGLDPDVRAAILDAAVRIASHVSYRSLCTVEFLVDASVAGGQQWVFMEANPRIQVEHTVTEQVLGLDLVAAQLRIADGRTLKELDLSQDIVPSPRGSAIQLRVNMERMSEDGIARPTGGTIRIYEPPSGPDVRIDGFGYADYTTSARYDSLLAKVVVRAPDLQAAIAKARRALAEFRIEGVDVNLGFLQAILESGAIDPTIIHTRWVDGHIPALLAAAPATRRYFGTVPEAPAASDDPLAVLATRPGVRRNGKADVPSAAQAATPEGTEAVVAPLTGLLATVLVQVGDVVHAGDPVAVVEAMKMEHVVTTPWSGTIHSIVLSAGSSTGDGDPLLFIEPQEMAARSEVAEIAVDLDAIRSDLARVREMKELTLDSSRAEAVAKRHATGKRTARENIEDLCDEGSFFEYGQLVTMSRSWSDTPKSVNHRLLKAPGDGLVMGIGSINSGIVSEDRVRCAVMSYDYTVFAGTQGRKNHDKTDRLLEVARKQRLPVILYTEGGGGRSTYTFPGDIQPPPTSTGGLKYGTWRRLARLTGEVPLVGIASGRCFAGNAVLLALCHVIIATRDATLGIGGPAMIEGGGLGRFSPEDVGPVSVQAPNGVIDFVAEDEAEATIVAKRYLSFFQGRTTEWEQHDQRTLRNAVPENRRAPYDIRALIKTLVDVDTMLELRAEFGVAMLTAFARIEGRPIGIVANNNLSPTGGAVDADSADKAARFMQLCDAFDLPILTLIDVPGNMVGPEAEKTATLRHCARLYVIGANLSVPVFSVVLRKAYGLGALAMSGGGFDVPTFVVAWPTGEFAGMGLEGQVKLGRRAELAAIDDVGERKARYDELVAAAYEWAGAANGATVFEFDDVIDPTDTRSWLSMGLSTIPRSVEKSGKRGWVDTW